MKISKTKISLSTQEAFDCLYQKNQQVWRDAIDLIADYAGDCYSSKFPDSVDGYSIFDDGINFTDCKNAIIFESRK